MSATPLLSMRGVSKWVGDGAARLNILSGLDLDVPAGTTLAVIGASGAGKSTLLSLMAGLDVPNSGVVALAGEALHQLSEEARARVRRCSVGFVYQSFHLLPVYTALENVMLPLELRRQADAADRARVMLQAVGLEQRLGHYPRQLSGGEQQRVALARAFVTEPRLLCADEPTGNLDRATGEMVMDVMFSLNQSLGATLILVTHDITLARRCERQVKLTEGRVWPVEI